MEKQPLVVLTGPTAAGKTKLSIELARAINGEIISADSMQVYRHMDIGSAKIRPEEMEGIPHYLVDELKPWDEFHVVRFQQMAKKAMEQILADIQSGKFADEFLADSKNGQKFLKEHREAAAVHPIEPVGAELRNLMSWLK